MRPPAAVDELPGQRGDAREPLQKIESGSFGDQKGPGRADDFGNLFTGTSAVSVVLLQPRLDIRIELTEGLDGDIEPCEHAVGLDQKDAARAKAGGDRRVGRDVAGTQVFFERPAHKVTVVFRI